MLLSDISCRELHGVGPQVASRLAQLQIVNCQQLLWHIPYRYVDKTRLSKLSDVKVGDNVVIEARIIDTKVVRFRQQQWCYLLAEDNANLRVRFFHLTPRQKKLLHLGATIRCFGEIRLCEIGLEMVHPEWRAVDAASPVALPTHLTPVYASTEGLLPHHWQKITSAALGLLANKALLPDYFRPEWNQQFAGLSLVGALQYLHRPPPDADLEILQARQHPAHQRLAAEECLAEQLFLQRTKRQWQTLRAPTLSPPPKTLLENFTKALPFTLTAAQQRVIAEITADFNQSIPMRRLIQGDVGSGKTVIAAYSALFAVAKNYQVACMAPTELLAEQHYQSWQQWLQKLNITCVLLTGKLTRSKRTEVLASIANGVANIVIGTQALFQEEVEFKQLGLVIIDEQHRFGVHQRLALWQKGVKQHIINEQTQTIVPHQLIMTATPIPRTLAMMLYADLDYSVINELPEGRLPVQTIALANTRRTDIIERISQVCATQQQVYWVCTRIHDNTEDEEEACQAAQQTFTNLCAALPHLRIALIHGQQKSAEKEQYLAAFKRGEYHLLVATTVIEVGVDVPNASLMIIENAERLGLAQLHQLRGRVGRGNQQSYCVLLYQAPLTPEAHSRLQILRTTHDGFKLAETDLSLRGMGELLGLQQTGNAVFHFWDVERHQQLLSLVAEFAERCWQESETMIEALIKRWRSAPIKECFTP